MADLRSRSAAADRLGRALRRYARIGAAERAHFTLGGGRSRKHNRSRKYRFSIFGFDWRLHHARVAMVAFWTAIDDHQDVGIALSESAIAGVCGYGSTF